MNDSAIKDENKPSTSAESLESTKLDNNETKKRRSTDELDLEESGEFRGFGHYMQAKNTKLMHQIHNGVQLKSDLFKGISFHVNGHTDPPGIELRRLIVENGGEWHTYYISGRTTYKIAMSMAISKWKSMAKHEVYLKPAWIVDSLNEQTLLPTEQYKLQPDFNADDAEQTSVVKPFYERSRLHLISTLAQELEKSSSRHEETKRRS
ncbi:hypothetical protein M3Y97_00444000 [Aphelenchoides bicaudatus]|nr:hypothetical protein M3Y97_00444000 [Aphelenchoides bicaudatus]